MRLIIQITLIVSGLILVAKGQTPVCPDCRVQYLFAQNNQANPNIVLPESSPEVPEVLPPEEAPEPPEVTEPPTEGDGTRELGPAAVIGHLVIKNIIGRVKVSKQPNILAIFIDDLGAWNLSCYHRGLMGGSTPNIDRIAKEGAIFTDYYGEQSCTAGRGSFITGISPFRTGLMKVGLPGAREGIQASDPTLAELLQSLGYTSGQYGKNHFGDRNEFLPTVHGFSEFFGFLYHLNALDEPYNPDYPKDPAFYENYGPRGVLDCYATKTDKGWIDKKWGHAGKQKITDLGPLPPYPDSISPNPAVPKRPKYNQTNYDDKVIDRSIEFIKAQEKAGNPWFCWTNTARMHVWTYLTDKYRGSTGYGLYADGLKQTDEMIGRLLDYLDKNKLTDNTIVLLTTDNGAEKMTWPDAGSSPFWSEKGTTWEGGMRVPLLVRWPGVFQPGTTVNAVMSALDWVPTLLDATGGSKIPDKLLKGDFKAAGKKFKAHLDGFDFLPYFAKPDKVESPRKNFLYWSDNGELTALRIGDWKLNLKYFVGNLATGYTIQPNVPIVTNLRADPFEEAPHESSMHFEWLMRNAFYLYPAGHIIAEFMATLKDYPPSQAGGGFVPMALSEGGSPEVMAAAAAEDSRLKELNSRGMKSLQESYDEVATYNSQIGD